MSNLLTQAQAAIQYDAGINAIHQSTSAPLNPSNTLTADFALRYLQPNYDLNLSLVTASKTSPDTLANSVQYASPHPGIDGNVHVSELYSNIKISEQNNLFMGIIVNTGIKLTPLDLKTPT